ncbi:hypothetical protein [Taibaiella helva]|nr:hypothetical protein [Taibaiella helva]
MKAIPIFATIAGIPVVLPAMQKQWLLYTQLQINIGGFHDGNT